MNPIRLAVEQPVTVAVGVILTLLGGIVALARLPIALTPNVADTVVTVTTFWEGASPDEIEQNVIDKQEEKLIGLANLNLMTSTSSQGSGKIRLQFRTGVNKDSALREVAQKLNEVPFYPDNVDEPIIEQSDSENRDYIAWIVFGSTDPTVDIGEFRDFAVDRIEPLLENVPGISEINVLGGREREMQLHVDPIRMADQRITPGELAQVIRDVNQNRSAGRVATGKRDQRLRMISQYDSTESIEATVVRDDGAGPIRVGDFAIAQEAYKEEDSFVRSSGQPVIAINADRELDSNIMTVMAGLKAEIDRLNAPGGLLETEANRRGINGTLTLRQVYDQTVYIEDALALVRSNIWIGGGLAVVVLLIFLRSIRSVGIIGLAIPISVVGTVVAMVAMARSVNVISLAGMAFAVGMVVDNAIVVLENIYRHLEMGKSPRVAAIDGAREVWGAVLASTLTTIAVFIPILMIEEEAGQLFRDIALAICASVALSLIVSITLIPTAAARILRAPARRQAVDARGGTRTKRRAGFAGRLARFVEFASRTIVLRLAIILTFVTVAVAGTVLLIPDADYLPSGNRNLIFGFLIPPPGYSLEQNRDIATRIEKYIQPYWEAGAHRKAGDEAAYKNAVAQLPSVGTFDWMTGQPGPDVTPPAIENYFIVSFGGILFHGAISADSSRAVDLIPLFNQATNGLNTPDLIAFAIQVPLFQLGGTSGSAIKLQLAGPSIDEVKSSAEGLFFALGQAIGFQKLRPEPGNFNLTTPEIRVIPDLVRLSELGMPIQDVAIAVQTSGDGAIIGEYVTDGDSIDFKVLTTAAVTGDGLDQLASLPIATPSGEVVSLAQIATVEAVGVPQEIARVGRQRSVTIEVTPDAGEPLESLVRTLEDMIAGMREQGAIPASVQSNIEGSASKLARVKSALLGDGSLVGLISSSLFLALVVVYLLMCVLFQDFLRPFVIMFSVPLATLGGFAALAAVSFWSVTDRHMPVQQLDVLTMLGFVLLIGVVVNNAILIVHQASNFMKHGLGDADGSAGREEAERLLGAGATDGPVTPSRAIALAVGTRVRPIFMSTMTSVGGMLPLVLMPGAGSELYRGLGSVVVGGLVVSTVFTLLLVPMLLSFFLRGNTQASRPEAPAAD